MPLIVFYLQHPKASGTSSTSYACGSKSEANKNQETMFEHESHDDDATIDNEGMDNWDGDTRQVPDSCLVEPDTTIRSTDL